MNKKLKENFICACRACEQGTLFATAVLFLTLLAGLLYLILAPKQTFSQEENRSLEKAPKLRVQSLLDGSFMESAESYVGDHFMLRKQFIQLNTECQLGMGRRDIAGNYAEAPGEGGVYFGADHHLYEELLPNKNNEFDRNAKALRYFSKKVGRPLSILPVPSGSQEQPENLPYSAPNHDQHQELKALQSLANKDTTVVDVFDTLALSTGEDYYYKTDHHWNTFGAYEGYRELMMSMKLTPTAKQEFDFKPISTAFYGTLYSKALTSWQQPDTLYLPVYKKTASITQQTGKQKRVGLYWNEYLSRKDKYSVFLGGNHGVDLVRNPQGKDGTLLIIKDSYANSMVPFLATNFSEIHIIDLRYYNQNLYKYINENQIDRVAAVYSMKQLCDVSIAGKLMRSAK